MSEILERKPAKIILRELQDKIAHPVDDGGKGTTDDNTDRHIDHVAAVDKFLEFADVIVH